MSQPDANFDVGPQYTNGHATTNGYDVPVTAYVPDVPVTTYVPDVPVMGYTPDVPMESFAAPSGTAYIPPANVPLTPITNEPAPAAEPIVNIPAPSTSSAPAKTATAPKSTASIGSYEEYILTPQSAWPPPIFVRRDVSHEERFYLDNRWHSQWNYYDKKANESKNSYYFYQRIIVIGSVTVPVLVSIAPSIAAQFTTSLPGLRTMLDFATVVISLMVAIAAALESLYTYGDNWTTYRQAAEELLQEKHLYDAHAGRYAGNAEPFVRFVERVEEIVAKQNGQFIQSVEKQQASQQEQNQEILERYREQDRENNIFTANYSAPQGTVSAVVPVAPSSNGVSTPAAAVVSAEAAPIAPAPDTSFSAG